MNSPLHLKVTRIWSVDLHADSIGSPDLADVSKCYQRSKITDNTTQSKRYPVWELNLESCAQTLQPNLGFESRLMCYNSVWALGTLCMGVTAKPPD